ncbi:MAG: hypothetical protein IKW53_02300 [Clostridia bacterium]|nr:hypothetical protein [Clostridia bacterium]
MAKRRMFSISIMESDQFYGLSVMTQALYFHLCLNADDDGLVDNVRSVMRDLKAPSKTLQLLVQEGYVIELGKSVFAITNWRQHNQIKSDRYTPTTHKELKSKLSLDEDNRYFKASEEIFGDNCAPQYSIDKNSKDKNREVKISTDYESIDKLKEEKKKEEKDNISLLHTDIHSIALRHEASDIAESSQKSSDADRLTSSAFLNAVKLYFMKHYGMEQINSFIEYYQARNWMGNDEKITVENYRRYIDSWMAG